jgi:hypothetical protein
MGYRKYSNARLGHITCDGCGCVVSDGISYLNPNDVWIRAYIECPECIDKSYKKMKKEAREEVLKELADKKPDLRTGPVIPPLTEENLKKFQLKHGVNSGAQPAENHLKKAISNLKNAIKNFETLEKSGDTGHINIIYGNRRTGRTHNAIIEARNKNAYLVVRDREYAKDAFKNGENGILFPVTFEEFIQKRWCGKGCKFVIDDADVLIQYIGDYNVVAMTVDVGESLNLNA